MNYGNSRMKQATRTLYAPNIGLHVWLMTSRHTEPDLSQHKTVRRWVIRLATKERAGWPSRLIQKGRQWLQQMHRAPKPQIETRRCQAENGSTDNLVSRRGGLNHKRQNKLTLRQRWGGRACCRSRWTGSCKGTAPEASRGPAAGLRTKSIKLVDVAEIGAACRSWRDL
jgi:hypothetical protein